MAAPDCPSAEVLSKFHLGALAPDELDRIGTHLETCSACEARMEAVDGTVDRVLEGLRQARETGRELFSIRPGLIVDEYEILEPLGAGGMGRVWKARHRRMNRIVAFKVLARGLDPAGRALERFQREVEALAALSHPNVALAYDAGVHADRPYLVMEYLEGCDLERYIKESGPLSTREACGYIRQAAQGLAFAHSRDLIHRDVKPANLFRAADGTIKVLDLGLVRRTDDREIATAANPQLLPSSSLTTATTMMGTLNYMAPEQSKAAGSADHRADIYSLGCTLFAALTGASPFARDLPEQTLLAHRDAEPPSLRAARPDVPLALDHLYRRMLAKDPADRPASMNEVLVELDRQLAPPRRPYRFLGLAASLVLVVGVGSGIAYWFSTEPPPPPPAVPTPSPDRLLAPFEAPQAIAYQAAWAQSLRLPVKDKNSLGMPLVLIPPGGDANRSEALDQPLYFAAHETTVASYRQFVQATGYVTDPVRGLGGWVPRYDRKPNQSRLIEDRSLFWENPGFVQEDNYPIVQASWNDAMAFCRWLGAKEGAIYRLPDLAEALWAMKAGASTKFYFGDDSKALKDHAWYDANSNRRTRPVGFQKSNAWGLFDTLGNVHEWCRDWHTDSQIYKRGTPGSYFSDPASVSDPVIYHFDKGFSIVGFRVVREVGPP